jgi:repressor LexA
MKRKPAVLTKKQKDLLTYIHAHLQGDDIPPSFEEMKDALGLKSKSGIHRLITALEERGYIRRLPHRARALEILRLPEGMTEDSDDGAASNNFMPPPAAYLDIPVMGRIAAGTPIEAVRNEQDNVSLPPDMIGGGEHYALIVDGESMIKAGINDGDTVIIRRCQDAENGAIVVALVDGEEVTLKRLRRAGSKIVLEPENDDFEPQILEPERVAIQGRLVSLMRSYH